MRRREVIRFLSAGAGFGLLAACAPIAPPNAAPTSAPAQPIGAGTSAPKPAAGQPRAGGTLRFAQNVEIAAGGQAGTSPLDGQNVSPAPLSAIWLGFDSLVRYDQNNQP